MSSRSFTEVTKAWLDHQDRMARTGRIVPATAKVYKKIVKTLAGYFGDRDVRSIHTSDADNYGAWRRAPREDGSQVAVATVNLEYRVLRAILSFASSEGYLDDDPPRVRSLPEPAVETDLPPIAAICAIIDRQPEYHADALRFSAMTGLSWHELERLQWRDIDTRRRLIQIGRRPDFAVKTPARARTIPMSKDAALVIARVRARAKPRPAETDQVFPYAGATMRSLSRLRQHGDPIVTCATMRKVFAATMASKSVPEPHLQRLLGHAPGSSVTRRHYVRATGEMLAEAVAAGGRVL
jgi:integrase